MTPLLFLLLALPRQSSAVPIEATKIEAEAQFGSAIRFGPMMIKRFIPDDDKAFSDAHVRPWPGGSAPVVARFPLAPLLDRHRELITRRLGPQDWTVSLASDPGARTLFLSFAQQGALVSAFPLGQLDRLRGDDGVDVQIAPGLYYNMKISVSIWHPTVRGSTLHFVPTRGTTGPRHEVRLGALIDALEQKAQPVTLNGVQLWVFYGTDVSSSGQLLASRTLLFVLEDGRDSHAWPVSESDLVADRPIAATVNGVNVVLTRTSGGELVVQHAP